MNKNKENKRALNKEDVNKEDQKQKLKSLDSHKLDDVQYSDNIDINHSDEIDLQLQRLQEWRARKCNADFEKINFFARKNKIGFFMQDWSGFLNIFLDLIAYLIVGGLLGYYLDSIIQSFPLCSVCIGILSFFSFLYKTYKSYLK